METLVLPGLDGTGELVQDFAAHLPADLGPRIVRYPIDEAVGYAALLERIDLPASRFAIVGESFSGPLGVMLAAQHPRVCALVLVASFVRNPTRIAARAMATMGPALFRLSPPGWALRRTLLAADASTQEVVRVQRAIRAVKPSVLARRLREIASVDVSAILARTTVPLLYVGASRDRLVHAKEARHIRKLRPDAVYEFVEGPHFLLQSCPRRAAGIIAQFVRSHVATTAR
jgi:pimeloyl-ACP methyl ester carboxylesterase